MYKCVFLALRHFWLFRSRVFSRALGSVARREPTLTPYASLRPDRGPRHVLWRFNVTSPGVTPVDEKGHEGNTAVVTAYYIYIGGNMANETARQEGFLLTNFHPR